MAGVYTVAQLNSYLKDLFRQDFLLRRLRVRGEVSNVKYHSSGHIYFTLKDAGGALSAVMFSSQRRGLSFRLEEGQRVVASGSVDIYERDGSYRLYVSGIEAEGRGELYELFLARKAELYEMGMFSELYKKEVPFFASRVGVVTAPTGAAIHDIMSVALRRNPYVQLILYPALVQGEGAAESVARGIRALDRPGTDVIIVGRGGGSTEDLWAFNEEAVARAIFDCSVPVISAVGHETDFTIADFVADLRAPTPSAAAELAVLDLSKFLSELGRSEELLGELLRDRLAARRAESRELELKLRLRSPASLLKEKRERAARMRSALSHGMMLKHRTLRQRFEKDITALEAFSPLARLKGGYAYVEKRGGGAVRSASQLTVGERIRLRFSDGEASASVLSVGPEKKQKKK